MWPIIISAIYSITAHASQSTANRDSQQQPAQMFLLLGNIMMTSPNTYTSTQNAIPHTLYMSHNLLNGRYRHTQTHTRCRMLKRCTTASQQSVAPAGSPAEPHTKFRMRARVQAIIRRRTTKATTNDDDDDDAAHGPPLFRCASARSRQTRRIVASTATTTLTNVCV